MGGTGGPNDARAGAQSGLQGAGLLADPVIPGGYDTGFRPELLPEWVGTGATQTIDNDGLDGRQRIDNDGLTPSPAAPVPVTPAPTTPVAAAPAPTTPTFQLPGVANLGLPSATMPLGTVGHTPFGTQTGPTLGAEPAGPTGPTLTDTPAAPAQGPMRQIWPPGGGTAAQWIAANPNWQTDFNRAEQRADGTWWVPTAADAPSPGPKYYQGTGNVIYQGSPAPTGGR